MSVALEPAEVSRVGFGSYRVWAANRAHRNALAHALALGCSLIDTASNYANGSSEQMIGEVLADLPDRPAFVVTKVGYVVDAVARRWRAEGLPPAGLIALSAESHYSLDPAFIRYQVELSRNRLQRPSIDAVLLHNPEHLVGADDVLDEAIYSAFLALEDCVAQGSVRYYGVSSNALAAPTTGRTPWCARIIRAARRVGADNHLRVIEFPFNFAEREAAEAQNGSRSLIDSLRAEGYMTIANRPLTGLRDGRVFRFADPGEDTGGSVGAAATFERCMRLVRERLREAELSQDTFDFSVTQFLRDNWSGIDSPDLVDAIFARHVEPFLLHLFGGAVPEAVKDAFDGLQENARLSSARRQAEAGCQLHGDLVSSGHLPPRKTDSLALAACQFALDAGIGHVVVGMRTRPYVESLQSLLRTPLREPMLS